MARAKKYNNQLKVAAATVTQMATMTATTKTIKIEATASLVAAQCQQWQRAGDGKSAAKVGSAAAAGAAAAR